VHFTIDAAAVAGESRLPDRAGAGPGGIVGVAASAGVARIDPRSNLTVGQRAVLAVEVERLHFFNPGTGAPGTTSGG
jgi:hypothetical protein